MKLKWEEKFFCIGLENRRGWLKIKKLARKTWWQNFQIERLKKKKTFLPKSLLF
jgi:hypothetical protein